MRIIGNLRVVVKLGNFQGLYYNFPFSLIMFTVITISNTIPNLIKC